MNIIEAIESGTKVESFDQCRLGRWLAQIPSDEPGLPVLARILVTTNQDDPHWRTLEQIDAILRKLGFVTSNKTVANHRTQRCRCFS